MIAAALAVAVLDIACTASSAPRGKYAEKDTVMIQCLAVLDHEAPVLSTCAWTYGDMRSHTEFCEDRLTHQTEHAYAPRNAPYEVSFTVYGHAGYPLAEHSTETQVGEHRELRPEQVKPRRPRDWEGSAHPPMGLLSPDGFATRVLLEYNGEENEDAYCLKVEWVANGQTVGSHESDCPPFGEHAVFPRTWSRDFVFGSSGQHTVIIRLLRAGRVVREVPVHIQVAG